MKSVIIAPYTEAIHLLSAAVREFPVEKIVLLATKEEEGLAREAGQFFAPLKLPVEVEVIHENPLEETFEIVSRIKEREKDKHVLVNCGCSAGMKSCMAMGAAFATGLKAFNVEGDAIKFLPLVKFDYAIVLYDVKQKIMEYLIERGEAESIDEIARALNIGPTRMSYHIHGNVNMPGLLELGLIEVRRVKGKIMSKATPFGRMVLKNKEKMLLEAKT